MSMTSAINFLHNYKSAVFAALAVLITAIVLLFAGPVHANSQRVVTIHLGGEKAVTVTTTADTVGEVLKRAGFTLGPHDSVEPSRDTPLLSPAYTVNIYRARPVTIVDGDERISVMSSHRSPRTIVTGAGIELYDADIVTVSRINDFLASGGIPGLKVTIDRAVPLTLILYGKKTRIRTQATTVAGLLGAKNITLGPKEGVSKPLDAPIKKGMTIEVYRNGTHTKTVEKPVPFDTRYIQDDNREVGYRHVKRRGEKGRKTVTYKVTKKGGEVVRKKRIASVVTEQPVTKVVVVGVETGFSGTFAEALAKLRACEGSYTSVNPAGPYYGAYQFGMPTWNAYAPPKYVGIPPIAPQVPPAVQDATARALYEARGWQPWPVCGADLPDIYR